MELRKHCAYNQTRECFLGLEVAAADLPYANLKGLMATLSLKSGEGLWMSPFRGIPTTGLCAPIDLIYLDEDNRVVDTVESFPTFQASSAAPRASSVLALPSHSIYSSQTQPGDQMVLCIAEEMTVHLERLSKLNKKGGAEARTTAREAPVRSGKPAAPQNGSRSQEGSRAMEPVLVLPAGRASTPAEPGGEDKTETNGDGPRKEEGKAAKPWRGRWWMPDPRRSPRFPAPELSAYYWDGARPEPRAVRDISASGMYLVTEERWYPGTMVMITLNRTDVEEGAPDRSIMVQSQAVRWDDDGVGLQFVLIDPAEARKHGIPHMKGAGKEDLERFLERLRKAGKQGRSGGGAPKESRP